MASKPAEDWQITIGEADLAEFRPYYTGNGRLGVRVGPLVLDWDGDRKPLLVDEGWDFWGRLNADLLMSLAKHAYDGGDQLILPAWNQLRLSVGGIPYGADRGRHRLRHTLDLFNGEVRGTDEWEYRPGQAVILHTRLVVPRSHPCAAWYEVELDGLTEPADLRFGLNAAQVREFFAGCDFSRKESGCLGSYTTRQQRRVLAQALRWDAEGWLETGCEMDDRGAWISLRGTGRSARLVVAYSLHSSVDGPDPAARAGADVAALDADGRVRAAADNHARWARLWAGGLDFRHPDRRRERLVRSGQFYLLASLDESGRYPLGPLGLSRPGWRGNQLWDADLWVFRAILPLWPELARGMVAFRRHTLPAAVSNAAAQGLPGALYPWMTTDEGTDGTPEPYRREIHLNAWVGLAAWEACTVGGDGDCLAHTAWPMLQATATYFAARAERDDAGRWHLRRVLPPDELVHEAAGSPGQCDDNVLTNALVRVLLNRAGEAAARLGLVPPALWREVADGLVILAPDADGVLPEYDGYAGQTIKQADAILTFYPLETDAPRATIMNTLRYYRARTLRDGGPLLTQQIEALLIMRHEDREKGLEHLFTEYSRYVRGPFMVPFETPSNANSVMLSGIGGLLQALIYGWYGATLERLDRLPRLDGLAMGWDAVATGFHPVGTQEETTA